MNKLTKLSIKKFRNVAPTTLEFSPGLNVLLGKNAAGKTTLLRLLASAVGTLDEALREDTLDISYRVSGASLQFEHNIRRLRFDEPALALDPDRLAREEYSGLQQTDGFVIEKDGKAIVKADVLPTKVVLEIGDSRSSVERRSPLGPFLSLRRALSGKQERSTPDDLAESLMATRIHGAGRMDESLERFDKLLTLEFRRGMATTTSWGGFGRIPRSMQPMLSMPMPEGTSAMFLPTFLQRAAQVLGYESASARFDLERLSPDSNQQIVRMRNLRFFFKRPGEEVSHDLLSYGQKRLLSFFAHVDASPDVVIADELVNGLHHEWISACLDEIGERQGFLTSQNPLLLDFLRFNDVEHVRRTFILCERVIGESGAQLVWRNPTLDEAESFFSAYETGIQRISDILLTKGLW